MIEELIKEIIFIIGLFWWAKLMAIIGLYSLSNLIGWFSYNINKR